MNMRIDRSVAGDARLLAAGLGLVLATGCGTGALSGGAGKGGATAAGGAGAGGAGGGSGGSGASGTAGTGGEGGSGGKSCGAIVTFETGKQPSAELHVAPGGSDASGDGTAAKPFATVAHAVKQAKAGTAIRVHQGSYPGGGYLSDVAGTAAAPIWVGGAEGEARPVIEGGGEGLHLTRTRYLVLHDLEVTGAGDNGINCDDGGEYDNPAATHHVVFRNLYLHHVGSGGNEDCLKLSGLNDFWVLDSEITTCGGAGSGSGIDMVGCHHGLIARNHLHDLSANAVQAKGGTDDLEIRGNHLANAGERGVNMGGSTGFEYFRPPLSTTEANFEARNIRVIANLIEGGVASLAFVGCVDCLAANNTIVDPTNWILRILQETTSTGQYQFLAASQGRFVNNLVFFDRSALSTYLNIGPDTAPETFVFANDLWYAHDDPAESQPDLPVAETNAVIGQDPAFGADYAIDAASPAAGAGMTLPELGADYHGGCYSMPPSIGADEVGG